VFFTERYGGFWKRMNNNMEIRQKNPEMSALL
jgi:hypothetical protein